MQPEYTTAVSRQSEHTRLWRWVIYKGSVEFLAGLSNTKKAAQSDANACLELLQKPAVELTKRAPQLIELPNGTWVSPSLITSIQPLPAMNLFGVDYSSRVLVKFGDVVQVIETLTFVIAKEVAASIAAKVNGGEG